MSRVLACAANRENSPRVNRSGVRAAAESSRKIRFNQSSKIRSKPLGVTETHDIDYHHIIDISGWSRAIGIQFP